MISEDQNIALLIVGNLALKNANWADYANYCINREKGLRKEAFKYLDKFLISSENWTAEKKIDFLNFLFPLMETVVSADYELFPHPLREKLIKPTLEEWCETEKADGSPFRWYGRYFQSEEHLSKAIEINPSDDLARATIISWWTGIIYFSLHHLPDGYIGDPTEDIKLGEKINEQIQLLTKPELRDYYTQELEEYLELVRNYMEWKDSKHPDFEMWGQENKKETGFGISRVYYCEK